MADYLELTPAQVAVIQMQVIKQGQQVQPWVKQLAENRTALILATLRGRFDGDHVRRLDREQSRILEQLIFANPRMETRLNRELTVDQQRKLDDARQRVLGDVKPSFAE